MHTNMYSLIRLAKPRALASPLLSESFCKLSKTDDV